MPTALVYRGLLYAGNDWGILTVYEARTGREVYKTRIVESQGGAYTASPVAGDGKVYFTSEDGDVYVVQAGTEFKLLATNPLGEVCMATPAISDGRLYFRTQNHVVAIGN
jgi:outer membrane protein assembly factor BamB